MKKPNLKLSLLTCVASIVGAFSLHATDLTWDADTVTTGSQDGVGNWTTAGGNINWWDGANNVTWNNATPDNAIFGSGNGPAGTNTVPSNTTNTVGNITFNPPGSSGFNIAAGSSSTSKLNLSGTPTITVASGVAATNLVVLSGTSFTKLGAGTLVMKPGAPNINAGPTVVGEGTLIIGSSAGRLLIPGNLTITNGATATLGADEQIADSALVTIDGGTLDSGSKAETINGLILDNNGQILNSTSSKAITNATVFDLRSGTIAPNLAGAAGLTKTTSGTVLLSNGGGANTFTGPVLISDGILDLNHSGSGNGLPPVTITITNTGMLRLQHDTEVNAGATVIVAGGTYELFAHNETLGTIILDNNGSILNGGNTSKTLTVNTNMDFRNGLCASKLGGAGLLTKSTAGTVTLTLDNANSGGVLITGGILQLGDGSGGNRGQFGTGAVTNNAAIVLNHSGAFPLTNVISGSGSLTNLGGSPSLTGANSYSGGTTVSGGTLFVNNTSGSGTGSGAVTLLNNSTLAGTGSIDGAVSVPSTANLAPGTNGIGTLTINNTLTLNGNTTMEISKGVGQDQVVVTSVNYGGTLTVNNIGAALSPSDTFQLFTAGSHTLNFSSISGSPGVNMAYAFNPASGVLSVVSTGGTPPTLNLLQSGNSLTISWTDAGFKLQSQTNSLTGTWFDYPGGNTSPVGVTINPANGAVFFRLIAQ